MCNNNSYSGSYYGYPGTYSGARYYSTNSCSPCQTTCAPLCAPVCRPVCNPCITVCPCPPYGPVAVSYVTNAPTATIVPSGTTPPTVIPVGSTTIPAGTVTTVLGYNPIPTTNIGGITLNQLNGQFTIPTAGQYNITALVTFSANATGTRELYIYQISAATGIISLVSSTSVPANAVGTTSVTLTAPTYAYAGDRIFFAVTQNSGAVLTLVTPNTFSINRTC